MKHLPNKQQGFTLLELLVVITLLAVLSVGALVAYEGVGENAQATAQANNTVATDKAIRNYRAVTGAYPNQWDNLSKATTSGGVGELADATKAFFGEFNLGAASATLAGQAIFAALDGVGVEEVQAYDAAAAGVAPNLQHNEGANGDADEVEIDAAIAFISIAPSYGETSAGVATACTVGGQNISRTFAAPTTDKTNAGLELNKINDFLEGDECHLVLALGFGHDAAHTTFNSSVAISSAPTFTSKDINPANNYARYIALFHLGTDGSDGTPADGVISDAEINANARMIAVVSPDGKAIDEALAAATAAN